jgi:UDPglucose--hexose-1-phosphate uridylyltransferase
MEKLFAMRARDVLYMKNGSQGELPAPSFIEEEFCKRLHISPEEALEWYYELEKRANYIKTAEIARNVKWDQASLYGDLQITINLSKPEKDPKKIAAALANAENAENAPSEKPKCHLCIENEGYGDGVHDDLRMIKMSPLLQGDNAWYFQYSPYSYYNEHCIVLNEMHIPMMINRQTFARLFALLDQYPGYFFGSNSDIPIVGGSILTHDHFQGGRHTFPIDNALAQKSWKHPRYENVTIEHIQWPLTTLRLRSSDTTPLVELSCDILERWKEYSNPELDIISETKGVRHNAITPIVRRRAGLYEIDLILRNNRTNEEFPDGIFHPHQDKHHIKKENIGLIEAAGLAILPPRLFPLLENGELTREYIGEVFAGVLEDSGVFKMDDVGIKALHQFVEHDILV